jgi:CubicO group peptidase (beta-lactamase class C family)
MPTYALVSLLALAQLPSARVDSIVQHEMRLRRIPGVAVAVVQNGKVVLKKAYGLANLETETPLRTDAVFELASVTKQFTAAAIMLLVQDGKVRLDEPIATYIDNAPATWAGITVRHLLNHTSGLDIGGLPGPPPPMNISTRATFEAVSKQPLRFGVGEHAGIAMPAIFCWA